MDRDDLVAFTKAKLRIGTAGESLLTDAVLVDLVNDALRKFTRERMWPWLLTSATVSVATTGLGTLPADYLVSRQLLYNALPVPYVGIDELLTGRNRYVWTENGTTIQVEPAPSASTNFTLWYYQTEDDLATGGASPIAPAVYHDIIGLWAAHLGALHRRDMDHAAQLAAEYGAEITRIGDLLFRKKGQGVRVTLRSQLINERARWS